MGKNGVGPPSPHKMNDLKTTSVLQKLYKSSTREGQVSLVSTHDVTNPPMHYCNWSLVYFRFQSVKNILTIICLCRRLFAPHVNGFNFAAGEGLYNAVQDMFPEQLLNFDGEKVHI